MNNNKTYLVTGALGCIGAWTVTHLLQRGHRVIGFDKATNQHRLDLLMDPAERSDFQLVNGDLTKTHEVLALFDSHPIDHVIHLAALQVPFCKADPVGGARVNVVGTVNIFEAARQHGVPHLAYASSIAVYGPAKLYSTPVPHDAPFGPRTLYGVYKVADEGIAALYAQDYGVTSTGLRPYTVYGVGRDQGMTSEPTKALLAIAAGQPIHISFDGPMQFQLASDVAQQFILAAEQPNNGAPVFNLGGPETTVTQFIDIARSLRPEAAVTIGDGRLPFPASFDDSALAAHGETVYQTPLRDGIRDTLERFERLTAAGRLSSR